ncbi:unnamed protein product [Rhizophagus irregularis]|nr:unnamed protein product [Rhizophagus irregularis]
MSFTTTSQQKQEYPLEVSFSKFHMTRPNRAGYNKIYEIRRSKSFFFEHADLFANTNEYRLTIHTNDYHMNTTPSRGSQNQSRNHTTKTFFNFSYKCYRFHFGIYIPCNFSTGNAHKPGVLELCKVPSPMILSHHRRACVSHQRYLEKFNNIKTNSNEITVSNLSPVQIHSNLIHNRWKSKQIKEIHSNRLGIAYTSRYVNNKWKSKDRDGSVFMYNKRLENFKQVSTASK